MFTRALLRCSLLFVACVLTPLSYSYAASTSSLLKLFSGQYNGVCSLESALGDSVFYSPVILKISKTGKITGTVARTDFSVDANVKTLHLVEGTLGTPKKVKYGYSAKTKILVSINSIIAPKKAALSIGSISGSFLYSKGAGPKASMYGSGRDGSAFSGVCAINSLN